MAAEDYDGVLKPELIEKGRHGQFLYRIEKLPGSLDYQYELRLRVVPGSYTHEATFIWMRDKEIEPGVYFGDQMWPIEFAKAALEIAEDFIARNPRGKRQEAEA